MRENAFTYFFTVLNLQKNNVIFHINVTKHLLKYQLVTVKLPRVLNFFAALFFAQLLVIISFTVSSSNNKKASCQCKGKPFFASTRLLVKESKDMFWVFSVRKKNSQGHKVLTKTKHLPSKISTNDIFYISY